MNIPEKPAFHFEEPEFKLPQTPIDITKEPVEIGKLSIQLDNRPYILSLVAGSLFKTKTESVFCPADHRFNSSHIDVTNLPPTKQSEQLLHVISQFVSLNELDLLTDPPTTGLPFGTTQAFQFPSTPESNIKYLIISNVFYRNKQSSSDLLALCLSRAMIVCENLSSTSLAIPFDGLAQHETGLTPSEIYGSILAALYGYDVTLVKQKQVNRNISTITVVHQSLVTKKLVADVKQILFETVTRFNTLSRKNGKALRLP